MILSSEISSMQPWQYVHTHRAMRQASPQAKQTCICMKFVSKDLHFQTQAIQQPE